MFIIPLIAAFNLALRLFAASLRHVTTDERTRVEKATLRAAPIRKPTHDPARLRSLPSELSLRQRLQPVEGEALGVLHAGEIAAADEVGDHVAVAIGQRDHGVNGNSLGVHLASSGFLARLQNPDRAILRTHRLIRR